MKFTPVEPAREFEVGWDEKVLLKDCGRVELEADEQVTFVTRGGGEYDVTRKEWGFYATPSLNGRLIRFGLRGVLVRNRVNQLFVLLVEHNKMKEFEKYWRSEKLEVIHWLDTDEAASAFQAK